MNALLTALLLANGIDVFARTVFGGLAPLGAKRRVERPRRVGEGQRRCCSLRRRYSVGP
jgi:hypothetical protein